MEEQEIWKDIPGFEGSYMVSNFGRIKSLARQTPSKNHSFFVPERIMKPKLDRDKYGCIGLSMGHKKYIYKKIHRLVAEAFIPNPENKPQVNHIDGVKLNNHYSNLEWVNNSENMLHAVCIGLVTKTVGSRHPWAKLTEEDVKEIRKKHAVDKYNFTKIAKIYNVSITSISDIIKYKSWKHVK